MKLLATVASVALAIGVVGAAQADTVYDTFGGSPCCSIAGGAANSVSAASPLGDQFTASGAAGGYTFTLGLNLGSRAPTGGQAELELFSDSSNAPGALVADLGTLLDSDFSVGNDLQTAYFGGTLAAGNYWLELISAGTNLNWLQSTALLSADTGAAGLSNLYQGVVSANTDGGTADAPFLLNVSVPEPATLAVFGSALAGLSALRRRRR